LTNAEGISALMRHGDGMRGSAKGAARQRWARAILCLLFAFGTVLYLGHSAPAQLLSAAVQVDSASAGADPCDADRAHDVAPCGTSSACSLCAPLGTALTEFHGTATNPFAAAAALAVGRATRPQIQPPRLLLQA